MYIIYFIHCVYCIYFIDLLTHNNMRGGAKHPKGEALQVALPLVMLSVLWAQVVLGVDLRVEL